MLSSERTVGRGANRPRLLGFAAAARAPYALLLPWLLLVGVGFGVVAPSVAAAGLAALDPGRSGIAAGLVNTARHVGVALGIAVLLAVATGVALRSYDPPVRVHNDAATGDWRAAAVQVGAADAGRLEDAFVTGFRAALALAAGGLGLAAVVARRGLAG